MSIKNKHKLGQFYTTNYEYILQNLNIPENITKIIEPFTGNGDLLNFIKNKDKYIDNTPKLSARSYAILVIQPKLDIKQQEKIVELFNNYLNEKREECNSLFLSNYRESTNNIARKRISFKLVYEICNYLYN
jgi:hypothetical protein